MIPICETFESIQGEQQGIGRYCLFIRVFGCNLARSCPVQCDTRYSWEEETKASNCHPVDADTLYGMVIGAGVSSVVVTGGEPLLYKAEIAEVIAKVSFETPRVVDWFIETNGTLSPGKQLGNDPNVFFNVSPKLPSFDHASFPVERSIFKHVVNPLLDDLNAIGTRGRSLPLDIMKKTYYMPHSRDFKEYITNAKTVADWCTAHGLNFGPRLHLLLWDGKRAK